MENRLVLTDIGDDLRLKKRLQKTILRKREVLASATRKAEELEMDLDFVKYEYDVRIGRLTLRDNQLDLEIIRSKNIKRLLEEGKTYEEAVAAVEDTYYSEQLAFEKEQEKIAYEAQLLEKREEVGTDTFLDMRGLWKKLIVRYHPDLVMDVQERARREVITKQINKAYRERDFAALQLFETHYYTDNIVESTVSMLEMILLQIENAIIASEAHYVELRHSQWYNMKLSMEKANKRGVDIFKDLEKKLLDDVLRKIDILKHLKLEIGEFV